MKKVLAIAAMLVLVALSPAAQQKPRVAKSFIAAWNSREVEKVIPVFTIDVLYEDVTFGAVNHGSAELRKFAASIFAAVPDVRFELVNSAIDIGNTGPLNGSSRAQIAGSTRRERGFRSAGSV